MSTKPFLEMATAYGTQYVEYASAAETTVGTPIDVHDVIKTGNMPSGVERPKEVAQALLDVDAWLPFAAEAYNVSGSIKDYICVGVVIFLTDIPNANLAAFPFEEMSSWNTQAGNITYRTWTRKPLHVEHANDDPSKAAGIIFDSSMRAVPNYLGGLHRVVLLNGWDRNGRYPDTIKSVIAGRSGASMGAMVSDYDCSVCAASLKKGGCEHLHPKKGVMMRAVGNKLVYRVARGVTGFECSHVQTPAFRSAWGRPIE